MTIKEIMVEEVITVKPDTKVRDAVELMNKNEIGCLVVTIKEKPIGIITERDVLKKIVCENKNPEQVTVSEVMSEPLLVGKVDMHPREAAKLILKRNVKKLPIVDGEKLVGLITLTDIVRADHLEPELIEIIRQLRKNGWAPPKRMKKTIEVYIV